MRIKPTQPQFELKLKLGLSLAIFPFPVWIIPFPVCKTGFGLLSKNGKYFVKEVF